jgi:hypothetical protein
MDSRKLFGELNEAERAVADAESAVETGQPSAADPARKFQGQRDYGYLVNSVDQLPPDGECTLHEQALKFGARNPQAIARMGDPIDHQRILNGMRAGWRRRMESAAADGDADAARLLRDYGPGRV